MRTFMEWLALEFGTVTQQLKNNQDSKLPVVKAAATKMANSYEAFKKLGPSGEILINFLVKTTLEELDRIARSNSYTSANLEQATNHIMSHTMTEFRDFIFATWQHTKSKLNNPNYTIQQIRADSNKWHEDIAAKKAEMPAEDYEVFIELKGPWQGWKWVSLGRGYCPQEAKAMGHCGNSGAAEGDDILSLRDPEGKAHLTFIVNDGILGEMKGRGNSKPSKRYHPAIIELLKHPSIHVVKGGGYAPERNFSLKDLSEAEQKLVSSMKPNINNMARHMLESGKKDQLAWNLGIDAKDIELEGDTVTLAKYDLDDLQRIVSGDAFTYWFGDDADRRSDSYGGRLDWNDISHYADDETEELMMKVAREEGHEVESAEDAWNESDFVRSALSSAYDDAYVSGAEKDAWDSLVRSLDSSDDNGFWVDMKNHPYRLQIHSGDLSSFLSKASSDGGSVDLEDELVKNDSFKFDQPYNGFSGFDDELFLSNVKDSLKSELGGNWSITHPLKRVGLFKPEGEH